MAQSRGMLPTLCDRKKFLYQEALWHSYIFRIVLRIVKQKSCILRTIGPKGNTSRLHVGTFSPTLHRRF